MRRLILLAAIVPGLTYAADPHAPAKAMIGAQCGSCHSVPGVSGAVGKVGPSLRNIARQSMIAGKLPNTPDNMARWIMHPQQVDPGNAMPEMGLTGSQARTIAAYLETLDRQ